MEAPAGETPDLEPDALEGDGDQAEMEPMEPESAGDAAMPGAGMEGDAAAEAASDGESAEMPQAEAQGETTAVNLPAWQSVALTNAVTGESFTLADFQGKTVFVEPMATWCGNCRKQQGHVQQAKGQLGDEVVFIGLSLETELPAEQLAAYAQGNGFDWTYAVMPLELLEGLANEFGRTITNAPSTPHFIIRPDGSFSELATGIHSADEIIAEIQAAQG
jgi:thiol-disulfide isomerase/thioredoxin